MQVIGLDIGTSGVKSTVFDEKANVLSHAYREYDLIGREKDEYELDPQVLLNSCYHVLVESTRGMEDVRAICATSFGEAFVNLDEEDRPLMNSMIYMDKRGTEECAEYLARYTREEIFETSGQFVDPMFAVYKLRWINKHRNEVMKKTRRICFIADYVTYSLGAGHVCDYSLAARSSMFDVHKKTWIKSAVEFSRIDPRCLPEPIPGGSVAGEMSEEAAKKLGMKAGVKLIIGGHDQVLAALGGGAKGAGDVMNGMGTVDCFTAIMDENGIDQGKLLKYNLPLVPYLDTGLYASYAFNMSGGCVVKWFRDTVAQDIAGREDAYDLLNREAPGEPTGLLVIPYLAGGGVPYMDALTPGVVAGLRIGTSRGKLLRAFLEGESYEMMSIIECLEDAGMKVHKVVTVGGGTKSPLWMQIRADIFARSIYLPSNSEAGTLASAMLCYVGLGLYDDVWAAQRDMVSYARAFTPDSASHAQYADHFKRYKALYQAVKGVYA